MKNLEIELWQSENMTTDERHRQNCRDNSRSVAIILCEKKSGKIQWSPRMRLRMKMITQFLEIDHNMVNEIETQRYTHINICHHGNGITEFSESTMKMLFLSKVMEIIKFTNLFRSCSKVNTRFVSSLENFMTVQTTFASI